MKWVKVDQRTGQPMVKAQNQYEPHDYVSGKYKIINRSFTERKGAWILTENGEEIRRFNQLRQAKAAAEEREKGGN
jgi:hypothetical protein